jgi:broad specificity phosphatase PhoE
MAELYFVRHGQAAFGEADYDRLSPLGWDQARWLGEHFRALGLHFDRVAAGTLRRQKETAEGVVGHTQIEELPGLDEYDFRAIMAAYFRDRPAPDALHTDRKTHFRHLREILLAWSQDQIEDPPERWGDFEARVHGALADLCDPSKGERVLAASSGGPTAMVMRHVLDLAPPMTIRVNLQVKNASFARYVFTGRNIYLNTFNATPHLDRPDRAHAVTYS